MDDEPDELESDGGPEGTDLPTSSAELRRLPLPDPLADQECIIATFLDSLDLHVSLSSCGGEPLCETELETHADLILAAGFDDGFSDVDVAGDAPCLLDDPEVNSELDLPRPPKSDTDAGVLTSAMPSEMTDFVALVAFGELPRPPEATASMKLMCEAFSRHS